MFRQPRGRVTIFVNRYPLSWWGMDGWTLFFVSPKSLRIGAPKHTSGTILVTNTIPGPEMAFPRLQCHLNRLLAASKQRTLWYE